MEVVVVMMFLGLLGRLKIVGVADAGAVRCDELGRLRLGVEVPEVVVDGFGLGILGGWVVG